MARTKDETIREITQEYLDNIDIHQPPAPADIQADILAATGTAFDLENSVRAKGDTWRKPDKLIPAQIADILLKLYNIVNIACAGINSERDYDLLAIYQTEGDNEGIYISSEHAFHTLAQDYCYSITSRDVTEVEIGRASCRERV